MGLVLAIVGSFLIANAILFRHPRALVAEHFGSTRRPLASIGDYIFHRVNLHLGFFFLLCGFAVQLYGHTQPALQNAEFPTPWVGAILLVAVALEVVGWWFSRRLFRRYVRRFLVAHPEMLGTDGGLAREVGDLFGLPTGPEDTVQSYRARLRQRLGIHKSGAQVGGAHDPQLPRRTDRDKERREALVRAHAGGPKRSGGGGSGAADAGTREYDASDFDGSDGVADGWGDEDAFEIEEDELV